MTKSKRENLCFSVAVSVAVEIAAYFLLALVLSYFAAPRSSTRLDGRDSRLRNRISHLWARLRVRALLCQGRQAEMRC